MNVRYFSGPINSLYRAAEVMDIGAAVVLTSDGKWEKAGDDVKPAGIALQRVNQISSGFNIYNSSYDKGESSTYDGRRNEYSVTYCNVGDPLGVLQASGAIIDDYENYVGTVTPGQRLCSNADGKLKVTTNADEMFAEVEVGGTAGTDKIRIRIL